MACSHTKRGGKHCTRCPLHSMGARRRLGKLSLPALLSRRGERPEPQEKSLVPAGMTRRSFLQKMGTVGAVGVSLSVLPNWMPRMAFAQTPDVTNGEVVIVVFLRGGIDGLAAVAPYFEGRAYYDNRPTQHLKEPGRGAEAAIDLDGRFGLHPSLLPLKTIYDGGDLAFVHATGLTDPTRSHFDAMMMMEFGIPGTQSASDGWLARYLKATAARNGSPFRAVGMGQVLPTSLMGGVSALALQSIADFHMEGRPDELQRMQRALADLYTIQAPQDELDQQARLAFDTFDQIQSLQAVAYEPANGAAYPESEFGMGLQQIAQMTKADVGLELAAIDLGGWDTHEQQGTFGGTFDYLLQDLANGLSAFYADMGQRMRHITVVTMSEFGRTIDENGSAGTDHGHGNFMMLMGGGVNGGQVYTHWPTMAPEALADGDLAITTDYRDVLAEIVSNRLHSADIEFIFPNFRTTPLGLVVPA
ncbi:MAG: DUF1501 domain-containing protein [Chloroflexi bacterium]|nr:DUF1501 domain-containing protein [Chloroflexota bacterium]